MATRKRVNKKAVKRPKRRRTTKETPLTKLDFWAIAANEVYKACRRAGMDEGTASGLSLWIVALILIG
jgi:hypothetical protein